MKTAYIVAIICFLSPIISSQIMELPIHINEEFLPFIKISDADESNNPFSATVQNINSVQFTSQLGFGTPSQNLNLLLSTDHDMMTVIAPDCNCTDCSSKKTYNYKQSSSAVSVGDCARFQHQSYGFGYFVNDTVSISNQNVKNVQICALYDLQNSTSSWKFDGFLGLIPPISIFSNLQEQGITQEQSFGLYYTKAPYQPGSKIFFGGINYNYNVTEFNFFNAVNTFGKYFWSLEIDKVELGNATMPKAFGVITTTMPYIGVSEQFYNEFVKEIPEDIYCVDVLKYPSLTLTLGGVSYNISSAFYYAAQGDATCKRKIQVAEQPNDFGDYIYLGTPFLRSHYVDFNYDKQVIGIAKSKLI